MRRVEWVSAQRGSAVQAQMFLSKSDTAERVERVPDGSKEAGVLVHIVGGRPNRMSVDEPSDGSMGRTVNRVDGSSRATSRGQAGTRSTELMHNMHSSISRWTMSASSPHGRWSRCDGDGTEEEVELELTHRAHHESHLAEPRAQTGTGSFKQAETKLRYDDELKR